MHVYLSYTADKKCCSQCVSTIKLSSTDSDGRAKDRCEVHWHGEMGEKVLRSFSMEGWIYESEVRCNEGMELWA